MRVLVTFAVETEFAPWKTRHKFQSKELAIAEDGSKVQVYESQIGESRVSVFLTGMGWGNVKYAFREVMNGRFSYCISSGLAGGLKAEYQAAQIVVARRAGRLGTNLWIEGHRPLIRAAIDCGARCVESCITSDRVLGTSQQKKFHGEVGDIVDMESYHILTAASGKKIPGSVVIRAVSDTAGEDLPIDFGEVADRHGRLKFRRLVGEIGRKPQNIPSLVGFGLRSRRAAKALADFLDLYIPMIQDSSKPWSNEHLEKVAIT